MLVYDSGKTRQASLDESANMRIADGLILTPIQDQAVTLARTMAASVTTFSDTTALEIPDLLPTWPELLAAGQPIQPGVCIMHNGKCYRQVQSGPVTPIESQPPGGEGMLAIYRPIEREHTGTLADPIPWVSGMDCKEGKYYSYEGKTYLCKADMIPCTWPPDTPDMWQWEKIV